MELFAKRGLATSIEDALAAAYIVAITSSLNLYLSTLVLKPISLLSFSPSIYQSIATSLGSNLVQK